MEDRSKELEKNEVEGDSKPRSTSSEKRTDSASSSKKNRSPEDLLNADEDLGIDDIDTLEQLTLQRITKEWLNWNSQFFDYSDEPYLYYLAQTLSKDFGNSSSSSPYDFNAPQFFNSLKSNSLNLQNKKSVPSGLDIYSAFRTSLNFENEGAGAYSLNDMHSLGQRNVKKDQLLQMFKQGSSGAYGEREVTMKNKGISKFLSDLAGKEFVSNSSNPQQYKQLSEKALGQRQLRREYNLNSLSSQLRHPQNKKAWSASSNDSYNEFRDYYRKQTERSFMEEESKKVFVIINSFGGSVGNGITVHDALQFIKAGSLTLGLGVAASASSLVLAGGTIGERYVTEGCHTMIHQPECLSPDHQVLTDKGWLNINEVTTNHKVAVLKEGKYLSYENPSHVHHYDYEGKMYKVKVQGVNLLTTPNHRMFVATENIYDKQDKNYSFKTAESLYHEKACYKKTAIWDKPDYQIVLPAVDYYTESGAIDTNKGKAKPVNTDAFLKLFGFWIAEDHGQMTKYEKTKEYETGSATYEVCFTQKKPVGIAFLEECLDKLNFRATKTIYKDKEKYTASGATRFVVTDKQLCSFFMPYSVGSKNKFLPEFVWDLSPRQCRLLIEGLIMGDGCIKKDGTQHYYTSSIRLANDISRLFLHAGYTSSMWEDKTPSRLETIREIGGQEIKSDNPLYVVNLIETNTEPCVNYNKSNNIFVDSFVDYKGTVHCLTVPDGVFYVQKEGIPVWTGNSQLQGQASDIWIDSQEIMKIRLDVADIYSLSTYRPRHKILRDLDRDFYLNAPETIAYGLADEIATNEVMSEIVEMTSKIWDVYDGKQQRLLESRESASSGSETQTQS
jgi:ATP-dependent protease ClpP protease subunit